MAAPRKDEAAYRDARASMRAVERAFLDLAFDRELISREICDEIESACSRARGEGGTLRPWRAVVVRGHVSQAEAEQLLAHATARLEEQHQFDSSDESGSDDAPAAPAAPAAAARPPASTGASDEGIGKLAVELGVVSETQLKV